MKKIYAFLLLAFGVAQAQIVNIPDPAFKAKLLSASPDNPVAFSGLTPLTIDVNGNGEIEVSEALVVDYKLDVSNAGISNLTGIEAFVNLKILDCSNNELNSLGNVALPATLTDLYCSYNNLTSLNLTSYTNIATVRCSHNNLTSLTVAELCDIRFVDCSYNQLTTLDLHGGYVTDAQINCSYNLLTTLHLPENTYSFSQANYLDCSHNQLSAIDFGIVQGFYGYLNCSYNQFTELDVSFPIGWSLDCSHNYLSSLNNVTAGTVDCSNNSLITMDNINADNIDCSYNNLNSITNISVQGNLICHHNNLASLDLSDVQAYGIIDCSYNQLTELKLPDSQSFGTPYLYCQHNFLSTLDSARYWEQVDASYNLLTDVQVLCFDINLSHNQLSSVPVSPSIDDPWYSIDLSYNAFVNLELYAWDLKCNNNDQMVSLNLKGTPDYNTINTDPNNFANNPNLAYICVDTPYVSAFQAICEQLGYVAEVNANCNPVPPGMFEISGTQYAAVNGDGCASGVPTPADTLVVNSTEDDTTWFVTPVFNGQYYLRLPVGSYTVTPFLSNDNWQSTPSSFTATGDATGSPVIQDFCFSAPEAVHDTRTYIHFTAAVPGFDTKVYFSVVNEGTFVEDAVVTLTYDEAVLDVVSTNPAPVATAPGLLTFNANDLAPFAKQVFQVVFNLNSPVETPPLNQNDVLHYTVNVNTPSDADPADNLSVLNQTVVNAYDPNDKTCLEGNTIGPEMAGKYLHYLIRFENTGNYPAQNVRVEDLIDTTKFVIESLEPLDGSHAFVTRITGNKVEFIFNNIMLPFDDANNDGWVLFRIKTKPTLVLGDSVSNTAGIYFNFNPPVITNTATTTFATMGVDSNFDYSFTLWPNPVNDIVNIESKRGEVIRSVSVYNTLGQELLREKGADLRSINVSGLAAGAYIVTITTDKSKSSTQLIKK